MTTRRLEAALQDAFLNAADCKDKLAFAKLASRLAIADLSLKRARVKARAALEPHNRMARPSFRKPSVRRNREVEGRLAALIEEFDTKRDANLGPK